MIKKILLGILLSFLVFLPFFFISYANSKYDFGLDF